jgi:hypothetical protein
MHSSYYYFGASDFNSVDDSYDPTRECFHIDGAIASDSEAEAVVGGGTPHHLTMCSSERGTKPNSLVQTKEHNLSRFKNCKPSSTKNEKACAYFSRPSSRSARHAHVANGLEREPATSIIASSRTGWANP